MHDMVRLGCGMIGNLLPTCNSFTSFSNTLYFRYAKHGLYYLKRAFQFGFTASLYASLFPIYQIVWMQYSAEAVVNLNIDIHKIFKCVYFFYSKYFYYLKFNFYIYVIYSTHQLSFFYKGCFNGVFVSRFNIFSCK